MKKGPAGAVAAAVLILLTALNTYFILRGKDENAQRASETRGIAITNCNNIAALARTERAFIERQESQSRALLEHGVTFGIPPAQLPKIIAASKASQAKFLADLDALTLLNCAPGAPEHATIITPRKTPGSKSPANSGATQGTRRPTTRNGSSVPATGRSPTARANPLPSHLTVIRTAAAPPSSSPATTFPPTLLAPPPHAPTVTSSPSGPPLTVPTIPTVPCVRLPPLRPC